MYPQEQLEAGGNGKRLQKAAVENECTCSFSAWLGSGAGKEPTTLENEQLRFRWWLGSGKCYSKISYYAHCRGLLVVMVVVQDQPLSKTSVLAHFWHWLGGGGGKEPTALENECNCSFLRVGV